MTQAGDPLALHIRVTGRVQGVGFRAWTRARARAFGLTGWVRNEPDGAVVVLISGPERSLVEMTRELHEGPTFARVTNVETNPADPEDAGDGFEILR